MRPSTIVPSVRGAAPLLSVCIPTYNRARMLTDAIQSVLGQSFRDFELVVVDNASTDGTERLLAGISDPRLRVYRNTRTVSMYENHNECLRHAATEWVLFLHSDELLRDGALETVAGSLETADDHRLGMLVPARDRDVIWSLSERPWFSERVAGPPALALVLSGLGQASGACFSRRSLQEIGGFSVEATVEYAADHDTYGRLVDAGWAVGMLTSPVVHFTSGEHRASHAYVRDGRATYGLQRLVQNLAGLDGWTEAIHFLVRDAAQWPPERVAQVLYLLALGGRRSEFRQLWDSGATPVAQRLRPARIAALIDRFGVRAYLGTLALRRLSAGYITR